VLAPCRYLETLGFSVTYLPVGPDGLVDLSRLERAFCSETILVSVMAANNEIGVLQPIGEIGRMCRDRNILFHTDAAQALGKIPLDVQAMNIDLMSLTAHKLYGPKGIGALYVGGRGVGRRNVDGRNVGGRNPRVQLSPQLHGGGQERGLRSGTLFPPQIVGFGEAVRLAMDTQTIESERLRRLRDRLWTHLSALPDIHLNGHPTKRLPNNLNVSFEGVEGSLLLSQLQSALALSSGSACSGANPTPSHVIKALGRSDRLARATLRFGLGQRTTEPDIDQAGSLVVEKVRAIRNEAIFFSKS